MHRWSDGVRPGRVEAGAPGAPGARLQAECRCAPSAVVRGEVDLDFYVQRDEVWKSLGLSAPARRALVDAKLTKFSQLSTKKRDFISGLHGMGPNAMKKLDSAMKKANVKFK